MDKKARQEKYERQTEELYSVLGKFAVHFEHVCQELRSGITWILHNQGLTNQKVTTILLSDLTAFPLISIFQALIGETADLSDKDRQIVNNIMKRCHKLTEERNDVIHNAWFIGWASQSDTDFSNTTAMKPHRSKKGGGHEIFKRTADDFLKLSADATELSELIMRVWGCLTNSFKIENNFILDDEGNARVPV